MTAGFTKLQSMKWAVLSRELFYDISPLTACYEARGGAVG